MNVQLTNITPDPGQPRKEFDRAELETLAASIRQDGLMQPITVRPAATDGFWIVAGERRYRAHCLLRDRGDDRFASIEVIVKDPPTAADLRVRQIVENTARADLQPMEEARAYQGLLDIGLSVEQVAARLGVKVARVTSALSLLNLDASISVLVERKQFDRAQAVELARLPDAADQLRLFKMLNRGELNRYHSLRKAVDAIVGGLTQATMFGGAPAATTAEVAKVKAMEAKVDSVAKLLSAGWKDGECVIAVKVSPDRAALMADKLFAIRSAISHMEKQLRHTTVQARLVLEGAA